MSEWQKIKTRVEERPVQTSMRAVVIHADTFWKIAAVVEAAIKRSEGHSGYCACILQYHGTCDCGLYDLQEALEKLEHD